MDPSFLPLAVLAAVPLAIVFFRSLCRRHHVAYAIDIAGTLFAGFLFASTIASPPMHTPLLIIDGCGRFYAALFCAASAAIAFMSHTYVKGLTKRPDEYFLLVSLATLGAAIIIFAHHFAAFFLGLEIMSVSSYALIAYKKTSPLGIEGAIKYLVLTGVASAFLLFGMGTLYFETGTLTLSSIPSSPLALAAVAMVVVGIGFKLAIVPFYLWTPDVYQGAPAPVGALIATLSKGSVFVFFMKMFFVSGQPSVLIVASLAIASMLVGNLLALFQDNIKRLLAYSSIAHMGYLLVALIAVGPLAQQAVAMYLTAYCITTLGAFCVITMLSRRDEECEKISSLRGLAWHHPALAAVLSLMLFSLAGLPITAGFIGKVYILQAAVSSSLWLPVFVLILSSTIGLFYYLRVISELFIRKEPSLPRVSSISGSLALAALTFFVLWLGVCPDGLFSAVRLF